MRLFPAAPASTAAVLALSAVLLSPSAVAAQDTVDHAALRDRALGVLETSFGGFRTGAAALPEASRDYCAGEIEREAYLGALRTAWLAWAPLDAYQFGPVEQRAAVLTVAFWPDKKDYVGRGLEALLALPAETLAAPETIAKGSAAAQGLPAIERLMFDDFDPCPAVIGIAGNVAVMADTLHEDWFEPDGWADLLRSAGPENPVYRSDAEVTKALFTALSFQLSVLADARLGRPLGTFDAPRGMSAEAWRAGLSFDIIEAQLAGIEAMLDEGFAGAVPDETRAAVGEAFVDTRQRIAEVGAPLHVAVEDPMTRIRVEGLQTQVRFLQLLFAEQVAPGLGVESGFSPADGD